MQKWQHRDLSEGSEKVTAEQRVEEDERSSHEDIWGKAFQKWEQLAQRP